MITSNTLYRNTAELYLSALIRTASHPDMREYEALTSLRHAYLGSFFMKPEDIKNISLGALWNFGKVTGLP